MQATPQLDLVGVYSAPVPQGVRDLMAKWIPDPVILGREEEELVYVVFDVDGASGGLDTRGFQQKHTGQAGWRFAYFHPKSFNRIDCEEDGPSQGCYRLCFFLHYYSTHDPIQTPFGLFWWKHPVSPAPEELVKAWPYKWPWA